MKPQPRHHSTEHSAHGRPHRPRAASAVAIGLRPRRWQRWAVYLTTTLLVASGLAWLAAHYWLVAAGPFGDAQPSPLEPWALRVHGVVAYGFVFAFGSMSAAHIALGWRLRRHLASGVALTAAGTLLAASALLLYYAPADWHDAASLAHWGVGLALAPLLLVHLGQARAARRHRA